MLPVEEHHVLQFWHFRTGALFSVDKYNDQALDLCQRAYSFEPLQFAISWDPLSHRQSNYDEIIILGAYVTLRVANTVNAKSLLRLCCMPRCSNVSKKNNGLQHALMSRGMNLQTVRIRLILNSSIHRTESTLQMSRSSKYVQVC